MSVKRCGHCKGSKIMMGGGMMQVECDHCYGTGKEPPTEEENFTKIAKTTKSYKKAKEKIKESDDNLSDEEAEEMLDQELGKLK
jgi:hypothetical protein